MPNSKSRNCSATTAPSKADAGSAACSSRCVNAARKRSSPSSRRANAADGNGAKGAEDDEDNDPEDDEADEAFDEDDADATSSGSGRW